MIKAIFWLIVILVLIGLGLKFAPDLTRGLGKSVTGLAIDGANYGKDAATEVLKNVTG